MAQDPRQFLSEHERALVAEFSSILHAGDPATRRFHVRLTALVVAWPASIAGAHFVAVFAGGHFTCPFTFIAFA